MIGYVSNVDLPEVADALLEVDSILITTHAKPDGDAIGSAVALAHALTLAGKSVELWIMPPIPEPLRIIADRFPTHLVGDEHGGYPEMEPDRIVIVDTGSWSQLESFRDWLEPRWARCTIIDHHLKGDDVAVARFILPTAAATAEIIAHLIDLIDIPIDELIGEALFVGIASDTGWFRFSNTYPATHELAARLLRFGVDHSRLYRLTEQGERPEKLALLQRALDSLEFIGTVGVMMTLRNEDFDESGAWLEETERFVDLPQMVAHVETVILLTETPDGTIRLSFRSKPGPDAIDVSALASEFGGGGHARAAGAKVQNKPLDQVKQEIRNALKKIEQPSNQSKQ